jgi:integral membrane sensor domain MASE1
LSSVQEVQVRTSVQNRTSATLTTRAVAGTLGLSILNVEVLTVVIHYYLYRIACQSSLYAGSTSAIFSILQAFGVTSAIAPPVGLALGGAFPILGVRAMGYWLHQHSYGGDDDEGAVTMNIEVITKQVSILCNPFSFTFLIYPICCVAVVDFQRVQSLPKIEWRASTS